MQFELKRFTAGLMVAAGIGAVALTQTTGAMAEDTVRLGKAFAGSFYYAMADVGKDAGIFAKHGINIEISSFGGGAKLQQALAAGAIDVGLSGGTDMHLTAKGAPMKAVGVGYVGVEQVAIVAPDSKYKSIADMKDTRWPAPGKASMPGYLAMSVGIKEGWGKDAIQVVPGPPPDQAIALVKRGELDAMTMDPTSAAGLEKKGEMRVLFDFNDVVDNFLQYGIFATDDFQKNHPDALKALLAAWYETIQYAKDHKDETIKSISAAINVPVEAVTATYDRQISKYPTSGKFDSAMVAKMKDVFLTAGFLEGDPDISTLYTEQYLPQ